MFSILYCSWTNSEISNFSAWLHQLLKSRRGPRAHSRSKYIRSKTPMLLLIKHLIVFYSVTIEHNLQSKQLIQAGCKQISLLSFRRQISLRGPDEKFLRVTSSPPEVVWRPFDSIITSPSIKIWAWPQKDHTHLLTLYLEPPH